MRPSDQEQRAALAALDLFHHCALWAYVWVATETGRDPPDDGLVKRKAYELYETELARKE